MRATIRKMLIALLGCAAVAALAHSWREARLSAELSEAANRWHSAIQNECARVGGIIQSIREESERAGSADCDWAGVYQSASRDRDVIAVSASGRAALDVFVSCLPPTRCGFEGRIIERDGQVCRVAWAEGPEQLRQNHVRGELCFLTWGDRRMLVESDRLPDFREAAAEFEKTGSVRWMPRCFVREGDEDKPIFGEPNLPAGLDRERD